jgi:hypothetical protein
MAFRYTSFCHMFFPGGSDWPDASRRATLGFVLRCRAEPASVAVAYRPRSVDALKAVFVSPVPGVPPMAAFKATRPLHPDGSQT